MKATVVDVDLYISTVILARGPAEELAGWITTYVRSPSQRQKYLDILKENPIEYGDLGMTLHLPTGSSLIWVPEGATMATFVHEVFHAASKMLMAKGIEHSNETDEVYAYLYGYLFTKLLKGKQVDYRESKKAKKG